MWPRSVKNFHLKFRLYFYTDCQYRGNQKGQKRTQVLYITFNIALEELGEDAIGSQLMEHTTEELLSHTCSISRDHHAEVKGRKRRNKEIALQMKHFSKMNTWRK